MYNNNPSMQRASSDDVRSLDALDIIGLLLRPMSTASSSNRLNCPSAVLCSTPWGRGGMGGGGAGTGAEDCPLFIDLCALSLCHVEYNSPKFNQPNE